MQHRIPESGMPWRPARRFKKTGGDIRRWHGPLQSPDILGCQGGKARASACCGGEICGFTIRL